MTRLQAAGRPAFPQSTLPGWPSVSAVVPVHRGGDNFRRCLESLQVLDPPPLEVIAAVDGDDGAARSLAAEFGARVIRIPVRGGPARARNLGAREASGDVLFFVDADVALRPDAVARVGAEFCRHPDVAAAFGSYDDDPAEPNFLSQYKNLQHHWVHQTGREEASTFWAGCGAVRRDVFEALGGFDETYERPSIEDIELGYRIRAAGRRIRLLKDLQCKHLKRWGAVSLLEADLLYRALPWTELILQGQGFVNDLNLKASSRTSAALAWMLLSAALGAVWAPALAAFSAASGAALVILNRDFYLFLYRKRGAWFLARALPWHWLYFLYCGLAFVLGLARHHLGRRGARTARGQSRLSRGLPRAR